MTPVTWLQVSYVQLLEQEKHLESVLIHNKGKIREIQQSVAYKRARNVFDYVYKGCTSDALRNATSGSSVPACIDSSSSLQNNEFIRHAPLLYFYEAI
jgi:hypothetical protein